MQNTRNVTIGTGATEGGPANGRTATEREEEDEFEDLDATAQPRPAQRPRRSS